MTFGEGNGRAGIKRLITVFAEAMSRVASRQSRVSQAKGDDTKADGEIIKLLITVFAEAMSRVGSRTSRVSQAKGDDTKADGAAWRHKGGVCFMD